MSGDDARKFTPLRIVLGRIIGFPGDGGFGIVDLVRLVPIGKIGGEGFGHEAEFNHGADPGGLPCIEDAVHDLEVVDRFAAGIFCVDVGRGELELGDAVAGGKQVMGADVDRVGREVVELAQEFDSMTHGGVVGLVVAEPGEGGLVRADVFGKVDLDGDGCLGGRRRHLGHGALCGCHGAGEHPEDPGCDEPAWEKGGRRQGHARSSGGRVERMPARSCT